MERGRPMKTKWFLRKELLFYDDQIKLATQYCRQTDPPYGLIYWLAYMQTEKRKIINRVDQWK